MKHFLQNSLRALFLSLAVLLSLPMLAVEVKIDGINYELNGETKQATVIENRSGECPGEVVIPESVEHEGSAYSVTSIGEQAFWDCSGLTSVTIPNGVTSIGFQAFWNCSGLTSVTIGNSVTSIGEQAFYKCSGLTSVTIPNSVTSIGEQAFWNCSGLTSVTIGNSVTSIGFQAFYSTALKNVYCYAENVPSTGGDVFLSSNYSNATLYVPAGSIESYKNTEPWSVFGTIDAISTEVEIYGINYDLNAETKQATVIAKTSDFYSGEVAIPESVEYNGTTYSVTSIGENAFCGCPALTSVTIGNSVTSIEAYAFYSCSGLTSVTIGNGVESIGEYAFDSCDGLTSVIIGNSVTSIGNGAFFGCSDLTSVTIPNSVTSIGDGAFQSCSGLTSVSIPNSVTSIGVQAFDGCSGLTSVTIGNSVTSIGESAFFGCYGLRSVTIPNSVTSIGKWAFSYCPALKEMKVDANNPKYDSREGCNAIIETSSNTLISGCYKTVIPNSVTSIGESAFLNCSGLTSVTIPNSVESIGESAFQSCQGLTSVTIPNSVTSIGDYAFRYCSQLSDVYCYAKNVPSTGSSAFYASCPENQTLHVPAGSVESYKETAPWSDFKNIVEIPPFSGEVEIDGINYELNGETKLATVIAKTSGEYSGSIVIPESVEYNGTTYSVTSIGDRAFEWCYGLTSVTIGNSVASIGNMAFYSCSSLTSVTIPNSVASIGLAAFDKCTGLTSVTIPNSVTSIGGYAFEGCTGLNSVTIGNGVESIGEYAFAWCSGLQDVYCYAENVPTTESNAFEDSPIENATLHVPANAVKSYGASWTSFGTITSTVEVSSVGYATLFLDYDAEIPEGIEAYIAKEVVGENLRMEKVENQEGLLPAETGVIIKAEAGKYDFNLYPNANSVSVDGNLFVGSAIETEITAEDNTSYYILAAPDNNVGMYPVELVDGAFVCKANKAYLPISSALARIYFDFGTETGIGEVKTENGELKAEIYDLSGRKVENAKKGIFIVNGKKVIK